jgi:hypothetical protein
MTASVARQDDWLTALVLNELLALLLFERFPHGFTMRDA